MQPIETLIPYSNGIKKLKHITIGDRVFDDLGEQVTVVGVSDEYVKDVYRITLNDGRSTECDSLQRWFITSVWYRENTVPSIITTSEMKSDYKTYSEKSFDTNSKRDPYRYKYKIPAICKQVDFNRKDLSIDPYTMGAFIGSRRKIDGNLSIKSNDKYVPETIAKKHKIFVQDGLDDKVYWFHDNKNGNFIKASNFFKMYPELVGNKIQDRVIPRDYLYNSYHNRLELIRGLMDNAGLVRNNKTGHPIIFMFNSERVLEQIKTLIMGLGFMGHFITRLTNKIEKKIGIFISVPNMFKMKMFTHPTKYELTLDAINESEKKVFNQAIVKDIEYVGKKRCKEFKTTSTNDSYITNDFIVMHN